MHPTEIAEAILEGRSFHVGMAKSGELHQVEQRQGDPYVFAVWHRASRKVITVLKHGQVKPGRNAWFFDIEEQCDEDDVEGLHG